MYGKMNCETLKSRRKTHRLIMLYKMSHNCVPQSLSVQLPQTSRNRNQYNIRDNTKLTLPKTGSQQHHASFMPSTIRDWNNLPQAYRTSTSLEQFIEQITAKKAKLPSHRFEGPRREQILHCRLRVQNADLQNNLYNRALATTPNCECSETETTHHYLLK